MDPLTHTLTAALLADVVRLPPSERTARSTSSGTTGIRQAPLAAATLIIAANLPDVDALTYLVSADQALALRRGWTHGILAMVALPILLAAAMVAYDRRWRRRRHPSAPATSFRHLLPLAYLGVASHPALDWLNTYGIRLLMPFSERWFYGDTLFIIDPWLWLGLGGVVFLNHSASRRSLFAWGALAAVTTAIFLSGSAGRPGAWAVWFGGLACFVLLRSRRRSRPNAEGLSENHTALGREEEPRARLAGAILVAAGLYVLLLFTASTLARRDVEAQMIAAGAAVEDVMVGPLPIRPLYHAVVVDTGFRYRVGTYDWLSEPRLLFDPQALDKPPWTAEVAAAFGAPCMRGMMRWVRFPWVEVEATDDGGHVVHVMDARYARKRTSSFGGSSVRLEPDHSPACDIAH